MQPPASLDLHSSKARPNVGGLRETSLDLLFPVPSLCECSVLLSLGSSWTPSPCCPLISLNLMASLVPLQALCLLSDLLVQGPTPSAAQICANLANFTAVLGKLA